MDGNGQVTTMMWIEAAGACSTTIDNCEFMNHENTYEKAQGSGFEMSVVGGFGEAIQRSDASWFWTEQTPNVITPGTWLHVAVTWDGVNVTRYLDGAVLADPTNPRALSAPPTFASSGWGLGIGCRSITANGGIAGPYLGFIGLSLFTGIVDEAALYDRALTPAEIAAYYAATD
jgi:hypothetical protein